MKVGPGDPSASPYAARLAELAVLPDAVRATAHIYGNAEVSWPNSSAESAIDALADAGYLILGLDARTHFADGRLQENVVSDYSIALIHSKERGLYNADEPRVEADVEVRRRCALADLPTAFEEGDYVLVTYATPDNPDDSKIGLVE